MFRNIFGHINGIEIYPILTLIFFMIFFVSMAIMAFRLDKKFISYMGSLPLDNENENLKINNGD
jgi:hypothetical protein